METDEDGVPLPKATRRRILTDSIKQEFNQKEFICCEYQDLSETEEREIFQRVQLGIPLTKAEAFRATQGAWQDFAELYQQDFANVVNCEYYRCEEKSEKTH